MDMSLLKSFYVDGKSVLRGTEFLSSLPTPDRPRAYLALYRTITDVFLIRGKSAEFWMSQITSVKCGGLECTELHLHSVVSHCCMVFRQIVEFFSWNYF
jgi:hypothetical protein